MTSFLLFSCLNLLRSQMTSKCVDDMRHNRLTSRVPSFCSHHIFHVIRDLLLNRRAVTWKHGSMSLRGVHLSWQELQWEQSFM